jgi:hypothetical protein
VKSQQILVDHFPAWYDLVTEVSAEHQVTHIWFGRQRFWNSKRRAAEFTCDQIRFNGSFRESRPTVGTIQCFHARIVYQNCPMDNLKLHETFL